MQWAAIEKAISNTSKIIIYYDNYNQGQPQFTVQKNLALNKKKEVYIFKYKILRQIYSPIKEESVWKESRTERLGSWLGNRMKSRWFELATSWGNAKKISKIVKESVPEGRTRIRWKDEVHTDMRIKMEQEGIGGRLRQREVAVGYWWGLVPAWILTASTVIN